MKRRAHVADGRVGAIVVQPDGILIAGNYELEIFDGAKKLGEITRGPPKLTAKNLAPGYHVFSVLGTDAGGEVRASDPVMVVVRTALTEVHREER